ncbi:glycosyltransferase [Chryseobacterium binzhouense]|uniref:glycosyltransferase n=1 Tax=Chryseobacterium binzhouense TaxID=2593646 RepID=UPI0028964172|nr:glycosyltransferase [Chryseobacterium binzhouense]
MTQTEKIKVLFRHRSMEMGGVEKVMLSIINNLNSEKFDITVCLNINQGELRDEIPTHVRKVFLVEGKEDFSQNFLIKKIQLIKRRIQLDFLRKNPQIIDEKYLGDKYDVEIAMTYNDFEYVLNSSNRKSKKIGWFHSEINLPKLKPLIPKILSEFPLFNHMIYCSQKIKDMMHEEYPELDFPKESVIINAIPIEEIKQKAAEIIYDFPDAEKVFISVGRLHTRKGFHKLIKAHSRLIKDGYSHTIIIIGDGEEKMNLQKMIRDYSVEETFFLLGNKMNPYPYLKKADYFILPSESEAWPLVIAESLILQKPIIATNTGDVSQMIYHEKTGYLINYNTEEMYNSMKKFMTEPQYVEKIRENLADIEQQFDNEKIFNAVENILTN